MPAIRKKQNQTLARALAPEEIRARSYVTVLHEIIEIFPCFFLSDPATRPVEVTHVQAFPDTPVEALEVVDVCLPFVLTRRPDGSRRILDVRRHRLAQLDEDFARRAVKGRRRPGRKRKKS
jgi:hypothetical protein